MAEVLWRRADRRSSREPLSWTLLIRINVDKPAPARVYFQNDVKRECTKLAGETQWRR